MAVSNCSEKLLLSLFCFFTSILLGFRPRLVSANADGVENRDATCNSNLKDILPRPYSDLSSLTCSPIWQRTFSFSFFQDGKNLTTIVLSGKHQNRWIGIGFSRDGKMVGSSAMVGWADKDGVSGIKQYHLEGKNISQVIPDKGDLHFTAAPVVVVRRDILYMAFQLQFSTSLAFQPILLAVGVGNPLKGGLLPKHINSTSTFIEFSSAHLSGQPTDANELRRYHGATAIIGWGILTPAGGMVARYFRHMEPSWYYLHSSTQFIGFFVGLISISIGRTLYQKIDAMFVAHKFLGFTVFFLAGLEVCQFIGRPSSDSKLRRYWNFAHYWIGRTAMILGVTNIFIGFYGVTADGGLKFCFAITFVALLTAVLVLEGRRWREHAIPKTIEEPPVFQLSGDR